jgi:hypothetical protein
MRVSVFRGTPTRPNGHKALELHEAANAVETTTPEPLDEQIESLLLSLDEPLYAEPVQADQPPAADEDRHRSRRRAQSRREPLSARVNQFDLFFVVTAVVLGFAVGLLTVILVNG